MNDKEINLAIAEACGYVPCDQWECFNAFSMMKGKCTHEKCYPARSGPASYCKYLDAMHEAEKHLARAHWCKYAMEIRRIISQDCDTQEHYSLGSDLISDFWFYHCTARQRAEAFLKTVGKWKENS